MTSSFSDGTEKEWIRRRQMRLLQVRKQSNDIAKQLRERVSIEEHQKRLEKESEVEMKFQLWKMKRLNDLEEMYRNAVNDFGSGHRMAIEEPDNDKIILNKKKEYSCRARERGETAMEQELREKREAAEKKMIPIQRKMITRQIEDIRSSLVRSISMKKSSDMSGNVRVEIPFSPKLFEEKCNNVESAVNRESYKENNCYQRLNPKSIKSSTDVNLGIMKTSPGKRKIRNEDNKAKKDKLRICPKRPDKSTINIENSSNSNIPEAENLKVDLGEVEEVRESKRDVTKGGKGTREGRKDTKTSEKDDQDQQKAKERLVNNVSTTERMIPQNQKENFVECYGYSLHHTCKLKNPASFVQRIHDHCAPNAVELAQLDEEKFLQEEAEKENRKVLAEKRGNKAIEKEKMNRSYNELLSKLQKLTTKEKRIKSFCHIPPPHIFMSDERRQEKQIRRQRIMDSKFERIYYETMGMNPDADLRFGSGVHKGDQEQGNLVTKIDFGRKESNLKFNSPASSFCDNDVLEKEKTNYFGFPIEKVRITKTPTTLHFKRTKMSNEEDDEVFSEIERILGKSRKLRQLSKVNTEGPQREKKPNIEPCDEQLATKEVQHPEAGDNNSSSLEGGSTVSELGKFSSPDEEHRVSDILMAIKTSPDLKPLIHTKANFEDLGMGDLGFNNAGVRNDTIAYPVHQMSRKNFDDSCGGSTSTTYRRLPPEIYPKSLSSLLTILGMLKESEGKTVIADELILKLEKVLREILTESGRKNITLSEADCREYQPNPQLLYYITKLLNMSREKIAKLNVSSDSDISLNKPQNVCGDESHVKRGNTSKDANLKKAEELERVIQKCKNIIEQKLRECPPTDESADEENVCTGRVSRGSSRGRCENDEDWGRVDGNGRSTFRKNDCQRSVTKDHIYDKLRRETSENANVIENRGSRKEGNSSGSPERKPVLEYCVDYTCPYQVKLYNDDDAFSCKCPTDTSLESFPDVMEELLKKRVLSSPFQWDGERDLDSTLESHSSARSRAGHIHKEAKKSREAEQDVNENVIEERSRRKIPFTPFPGNRCNSTCNGSCAEHSGLSKKKRDVFPDSQKKNIDNAHSVRRSTREPGPKTWHFLNQPNRRDPAFGIYSPVARSRFGSLPSAADMLPKTLEQMFSKKPFSEKYRWNEHREPIKRYYQDDDCFEPRNEDNESDTSMEHPLDNVKLRRSKSKRTEMEDANDLNDKRLHKVSKRRHRVILVPANTSRNNKRTPHCIRRARQGNLSFSDFSDSDSSSDIWDYSSDFGKRYVKTPYPQGVEADDLDDSSDDSYGARCEGKFQESDPYRRPESSCSGRERFNEIRNQERYTTSTPNMRAFLDRQYSPVRHTPMYPCHGRRFIDEDEILNASDGRRCGPAWT